MFGKAGCSHWRAGGFYRRKKEKNFTALNSIFLSTQLEFFSI
jgi:hypothetical protein